MSYTAVVAEVAVPAIAVTIGAVAIWKHRRDTPSSTPEDETK